MGCEYTNQVAIFLISEVFERHIPLEAESDVPECSYCEELSVFDIALLPIILSHSPELHKRSHKLPLVTLCADKSQASRQIMIKAALNHYSLFYLIEIEVYSQSLDQVLLISRYIVVQGKLELRFRDILDSGVHNKRL